ncbi:MAG: hypothetical protein ACD_81C00034G0004 [uncultured bacterium]|uniref:L,D-TPase catalytic domain-containing protein n=1 Tax=Candidatus Wolfebacteria bacterium GW2011_GWE2_44_13 TaxID=1619017 RepID=A0A0G1JI84_9BACT|nr:MAG: hypothetical protein ACD_81C00034G0004 [uncultured bacterium]KKT43682.1 MAG: hypothetical protein UW32_C0001G0274 [Candidatus Wolfebacteria bacterium GW2011_GWE2_44_13]
MQPLKTTAGILVASPLLFWGGWNIGKAVYPEPPTQLPAHSQVAELSKQLPFMVPSDTRPNVCAETLVFKNEADKQYCFEAPKLTEQKGLQIDLTTQKAILFENGKIVEILPVAYQSPEGVWFQTPTGYFRVGVMREKHRSSLFPVNMPYAIQITEDFFMHEIPFYDDGTKVTSKFSGGCLRFETEVAKRLFEFLKRGDQLIIYKTTHGLSEKEGLQSPVALDQFWIRQRFNSPLRSAWNYSGNLDKLMLDYDEHTGVDFSANRDAIDLNAYAITDGIVVKVQQNDGADHGMGATVIVEHIIEGKTLYGVYAHLASIATTATEGAQIEKGSALGTVGNSAYGCQNNWKVGTDGCASQNPDDIHLHFELKTKPVLENPEGDTACTLKTTGEPHACYGYVPGHPGEYGYVDPLTTLFDKKEL